MKQRLTKRWRNVLLWTIVILLVLSSVLAALAWKPKPNEIQYGMSFNTPYARELGLDWQKTYDAFLDDLGVRHLRLAAHWPMIEPAPGEYNFSELDYQIERAEEVEAEVILAVGRRLPRWPECHVPRWAQQQSWDYQKDALRAYITAVVERYRDSEAIAYWQVENEPFLEVFAFEHCGVLDKEFLEEEIALVRSLDETRPILVTDSGNLGVWAGAYKAGDVFGTSVYIHFWNPELGQFRTVLPPWFYRVKDRLMQLMYGSQETMLIELAAEPWLVEPIVDVPLSVQYTRMDLEKIQDSVAYADRTRYEKQYLWGGEWWYWLYLQGENEIWDWGKHLFSDEREALDET